MTPQHQFSWTIDGVRSTYRSNIQGFRSNSDFDQWDPRTKIVLVGDSFTWRTGVEYEDTFGALIKSELHGCFVYNLAMPGFGIDQMWMSVRHQALPMKPNLIVIGLINDNFTRSLNAYRNGEGLNKPTFKLYNSKLLYKTTEDRPNCLFRYLEHHSWLYTAGRIMSYDLAFRIPFSEWWFLNKAILDAIQTDCRENHVPVLFMRLPTKSQRRFETLRSYMQNVGANYIDLSDPDLSLPKDIYFPVDSHINAKGHKYVANAILKWIKNNMPEL